MRITSRNDPPSSRFTLVELLVVIVVIAMLASMLLPALKRARDKANDISCLCGMKQLHLVSMQYVNDFNDHLPPYPGLEAVIGVYGLKATPYQCPADLSAWDKGLALTLRYSYGANVSMINPAVVGITTVAAPIKVSMVASPGRCPLYGESKPFTGTKYHDPDGAQSGSRNYVYGNTGINYGCSGRHNLGSNYVCVAGNAAWMRQVALNVSYGSLRWKFTQ